MNSEKPRSYWQVFVVVELLRGCGVTEVTGYVVLLLRSVTGLAVTTTSVTLAAAQPFAE